ETALPVKIISQLDELFLGASNCYKGFLTSLSKLKPSCRVRLYIEWDNRAIFPKIMKLVTESNPRFALQVTHIKWHLEYSHILTSKQQLLFSFEHFVNMQYLEFNSVS